MEFKDQIGRFINLEHFSERIVSVVPSQTELLFDLGLDEQVVGITKFCVHPRTWFETKVRVGGTKQLHLDKIRSLKPDLILANKEENVKEQIEMLSQEFNVWVSDINTLQDAMEMIADVGALTDRTIVSEDINKQIQANFNLGFEMKDKLSVCYLIWRDPYMTVGGDTFINDLLQHAGYENIFQEQKRYPVVSIEMIQKAAPKLLFLSSEPYPFQQKHIDELQPLLPRTMIVLVDGEYFSWYGSRLVHAGDYFKKLKAQIAMIH